MPLLCFLIPIKLSYSATGDKAASWHKIVHYRKWNLADGRDGCIPLLWPHSLFFISAGDRTDGKRDVSTSKAEKRTFEEEEEGDNDKHSQKHRSEKEVEEEEGVKRGLRENLKRWTKRAKPLQLKKKKRVETESQLPSNQKEVPHHSKEIADEDEEEEKKKRDPLRSPEEKELQMIARRAPEERRGMEEEGSASRKPEVSFHTMLMSASLSLEYHKSKCSYFYIFYSFTFSKGPKCTQNFFYFYFVALKTAVQFLYSLYMTQAVERIGLTFTVKLQLPFAVNCLLI